MRGFYYTIELLEPVMANSLGGDTNSAKSLAYIPGSLIRGAVIAQQQAAIDAGDARWQRLFFNGKTRYLHAYPVVDDAQRSLPIPLAWQKRKTPAKHEEKQTDIFDMSVQDKETYVQQSLLDKDEQLKGLGDARFCVLKGEQAIWSEADEQINIHTQRDAIIGRAKEDIGAVFRYEALPAGLKLKGVILAEEADVAMLKEWLNGKTLRLGKSRTAGYGTIRIAVGEDLSDGWREAGNAEVSTDTATDHASVESNEEWSEESSAPNTPAKSYDQILLVTLSDTLVRDDNGQHTLNLLPALRRKLGERYALTINPNHTFQQAEIVGGFNRKWGLPLPQVAAIAAGSVFAIKVEPSVPLDELREWQRILQDEGLGERRVDGFGRIVVEWYYDPPRYWVKEESSAKPVEQIALTDTERQLAEQMLRRLLRNDAEQLLAQAIHRYRVDRPIPNSQLSRWRSVIYSALNETVPVRQIGRVTEFLLSEEEKGSAGWEAMRRARVDIKEKPRLTDWIREVLTRTESPWNWLPVGQSGLTRTLGDKSNRADYVEVTPAYEMTVEYRLRLIDGALALAAKPKKQGGRDA